MQDDTAAVRATAEKLVDDEQEILLLLHFGGELLGSHAIQGLGVKARGEKGGKRGVVGAVFLTGPVYPEGLSMVRCRLRWLRWAALGWSTWWS